ncbi:MAG: hypothetical protein IT460_15245 [Planctomycetes bacterium]|nr:hypothetical protein [Planctomycetota bacterium]
MAAITITAANVARASGPTRTRRAGEAISPGELYYIKASDKRAYKAVCTGTEEAASAVGVALSGASAAGAPFVGQEGGEVDVGAVLTLGKAYVVSATAGKCIAVDELVNPNRISGVGYPKTTSRLKLAFCPSGAVVPA